MENSQLDISTLSPEKRDLLQLLLAEEGSEFDALPLSFAQQRLWLLDQLEPGNPAYNMPVAVRLKGTLSVPTLQRSLAAVVERHEALRTTFITVEGRPVQLIAPPETPALPLLDLQAVPAELREQEAVRLTIAEAHAPFDLRRGPLLRPKLLRLTETDHVLLLTMHHIISDGWSIAIFIREMAANYQAFLQGTPAQLPELPIQYADYAAWQQEAWEAQTFAPQLAYWTEQLAGLAPLQLPADYLRPPLQTSHGARATRLLARPLVEDLKALSLQESATPFMTLLTAFKVLLARFAGQTDVAVGIPIAGRNQAEVEGLIGCFLNTLVLRTEVSAGLSFRALLRRVREVALGAYAHQDVPFEKLLQELQPERDLSRTPLFQVFFNMLNITLDRVTLSDLVLESFAVFEPEAKFDLTLYVDENADGLKLTLVYNTDLFTPARMTELLAQYEHLLVQISGRPDDEINTFSLVTPQAQTLLPNPTAPLPGTWHGSIHSLFAEQARRRPDHPATSDPREVWTYAELDARSNQLAHYLCAHGIVRGDVVAVYAHRSAALVWTLLGILKAGAAFVLLDAAYPARRLVDYLQVARPRAWLALAAAGALPDALAEHVAQADFCCRLTVHPRATTGADALSAYAPTAPAVEVGPDDLAYVSFTSGSTGRPKGVLGKHQSLSLFTAWAEKEFGLDERGRYTMLSGLSHDPLHRDILVPLQLGATLCIPDPEEIGTPGWLAQWMAREQISVSNLTPAMGKLLTETGAAGDALKLTSLQHVFFVGEMLKRQDVARLRALAPAVNVVNLYGTTETSRAVSYFIPAPEMTDVDGLAAAARLPKEVLPVGRGISEVQLLILNAAGRLAGVGEAGELYFRSPHLARGYLHAELPGEARFLPNPFTHAAGDRLYKTGDLGRYLPDGNVELIGRADQQVKLRGFRIELGEIEAALKTHATVRECVVLLREDEGQDKRLVAYVVPAERSELAAEELRRHLQQMLPAYMIPAAFVTLAALPLTPNGKVDRRALPAPDLSVAPEAEHVAPRTEVEEVLARLWCELLGLERVSVEDNFFLLGGHSLIATQLLSRVQQTFQVTVPLRHLFTTPTIAGLALAIVQQQAARVESAELAQFLAELAQLPD
ncbi:MAG TPA: amino acid adenylation domain-containing protein [Pyrinomonadaceae bacterium]|jgi:amino acid adenylation domain-containing protein